MKKAIAILMLLTLVALIGCNPQEKTEIISGTDNIELVEGATFEVNGGTAVVGEAVLCNGLPYEECLKKAKALNEN